MQTYEVGKRIIGFIGHDEETRFDIDDSGALYQVFFEHPTDREIEQFQSGKPFEIRFIQLQDVTMMLFKIGSLNWMDAPYTPHLSPNLTTFSLPQDGQGLALTLMFVDAANGEVKALRLLGLSERFTRSLFGAIMEQKAKPFDRDVYNEHLGAIFKKYKTSELVKMSKVYCKL